MTSQNFAYWLQGYLEIKDPDVISKKELKMILGHLRLVFRDDIDPKMGDKEHQKVLNELHAFGTFRGLNNEMPVENC